MKKKHIDIYFLVFLIIDIEYKFKTCSYTTSIYLHVNILYKWKNIDIVIIGAGIAGIASAYYLKKNFPDIKLKILESRSSVGGTWDQMRFPGVRADNDMYTYGFSFDPWKGSIIGNGEGN